MEKIDAFFEKYMMKVKNAGEGIIKENLVSFVISLVLSCLSYSLLMNNQLLNNVDGNWHGSVSYANGHELANGRWFWRYIDRMRQYISPDPVTSVMSLAILVVTMLLVLDALRVKNTLEKIFLCLMFTINPTVCAFLSYRYMSPTFTLSAFFSVLAAYVVIKLKKPWAIALSAACICLMMGLYQATIGCGLLLLLLYIPRRLAGGEFKLKELLSYAGKIFASYILGGVLYLIVLEASLKFYGVAMESYNGADGYTPLGMLANLPKSIYGCYDHFVDYYGATAFNTMIISNKLYLIVYLLIAVLFLCCAIKLIRRDIYSGVIFIASFLLVPIAANAVGMLAFDAIVSIQMTLPMTMCIPMAAAVLLSGDRVLPVKGLLAAACFFVLYGSYFMVQYDQQAMYMGLNATNTLTSQVLGTLADENLLKPEGVYCFVGSPSDNPTFYQNDFFTRANTYAQFGYFGTSPECVRMNWEGYLNYRLGMNMHIAGDDVYTQVIADEAVAAMPVYPYEGSIRTLDSGVTVVKLAIPREE